MPEASVNPNDLPQNPDVVIVGAGPIGLAHAWGIKHLNPNLDVVVYEKYPTYKRNHTLIMQYQQLEKLIKATNMQNNPKLKQLVQDLKQDPHIRTNTLQTLFSDIAQEMGVKIIYQPVVIDDTQNPDPKVHHLFSAGENPKLVIGADGTHSIVNESLFPIGNQEKKEFDYVLQLRYEVKDEKKAAAIGHVAFYQEMARHGLVANEYVGSYDKKTGRTPITMQLMISKEQFNQLQKATSKTPFKPFTEDAELLANQPKIQLDATLRGFIYGYLLEKIKDFSQESEIVDADSIGISVNEAPATYAKLVTTQAHKTAIALVGDAGLGLSYFKGLNAGLESAAEFFNNTKKAFRSGINDPAALTDGLNRYQSWFSNDFAPKKVAEVGSYSTYKIRSVMRVMEGLQSIKNSSVEYDEFDPETILTGYFHDVRRQPVATMLRWSPFPHRPHGIIKPGQFSYTPISHTLYKISKLLTDVFTPYKSNSHIKQDVKQPLVGVGNFFIGIGKIAAGFIRFSPYTFLDGCVTIVRGALEIATTPVTWLIRPLFKAIATAIHGGRQKVEENTGIQRLVSLGNQLHDQGINQTSDYHKMHSLLAICNDLHRKFIKATHRGQKTMMSTDDENQRYKAVTQSPEFDEDKVLHYYALFTPKPQNNAVESSPQAIDSYLH